MFTVSVLIPGEESTQYLLARHGQRGWWFPHGEVASHETMKIAAQRLASEVCVPRSGRGAIC